MKGNLQRKAKKTLRKFLLMLSVLGAALFIPDDTAHAAVNATYNYTFDETIESWELYSIRDADAGGNMNLIPWIIKPGGQGQFSASYFFNYASITGNFENYTPYWKVKAKKKTGYSLWFITEQTPAGLWQMYSYGVPGGDGYTVYIDAGIWYGDWMNHDDNYNNAFRLRPNGSWSTISAAYLPNKYCYTFYNNGTQIRYDEYNFDSSINRWAPKPTPNKNIVYYSAGTNAKGQAASCSVKNATVNQIFAGYYYDYQRIYKHFNADGSPCFPNYVWDWNVDLHSEWDPNYTILPAPTLAGYTFDGWYYGNTRVGGAGDRFYPTAYVGQNQNITLYAKWRDTTAPSVTISGTPTTWTNHDGTVTIGVEDHQTGIHQVTLYRKENDAYTQVASWTEGAGVYQKTYTYTEPGENMYEYRVIVTDRGGNTTVKDSNRIYIDRTAPNATETTIQGPGEYDDPMTWLWNADGTLNSEAYGLLVTIDASDKKGSLAVSNIKHAYIKVYDMGNPGNVKYYDINEAAEETVKCRFDGKETDVLTPTDLSSLSVIGKQDYEKRVIVDLTKDFNRILNLAYEVHLIDTAGNDAYNTYDHLGGSYRRPARIYGSIRRITKDESLTDKAAFKGGYMGYLEIITTGWVDTVDIQWPEQILQASLQDADLGQPTMQYNAIVSMDPSSDPTTDLSGALLHKDNKIEMPDTHNTSFTRRYLFKFWIPFYMDRKDENGQSLYLTNTGYLVDLEANRDYPYSQEGDGKANTSVPFTVGPGNIFRKFRASIVY